MIWWVAILPALAGLALWLGGDGSRLRLGLVAVAVMAATCALAVAATGATSVEWAPALTLRAELTPLSRAVAVIVPLVALAVAIFAAAHEAAEGLARLIGLLLVFIGAMELVVIAADLVTLLIGWELMGACSWALIGHRWRERRAMPSANYAFVVTRAGDLGLFLALFACVAGAGSAGYAELERLEGPPLMIAAFGVLVAAAAKAGQVPFAPWLFRAMDGPTSVSSLLHSSTMVAAGAYLVARLHPWLAEVPGFEAAAVAVGLATALAGGLVAAMQMHAKKVLAGSTSAQLGLMFAASGAGYPGVAILHLIVHAFFKAPLFFAAGIAHSQVESFDLRRMRLGRALPLVAALAAVAALALAAVPPLGGAWTKEEVVAALGHHSPWLALAAILAGGLSAAYAARFWNMAFSPGDTGEGSSRPGETAALAMLALASLALSLLWWPVLHDAAARALDIRLPTGGRLELALSLGFVALGLLVGLWLARNPVERRAADWLGLPRLIEVAAIQSGLSAAAYAARVDDAVFDAIPRGAAAAGRGVAASLGFADDRGIDGIPRGVATTGRGLAASLGFADDRGIDGMNRGAGRGAVALIVRATAEAARLADRVGETATDLIPTGTGRIAGMAGADARRLQTGMSHHYYVLLAAGAAAGMLLLIVRG